MVHSGGHRHHFIHDAPEQIAWSGWIYFTMAILVPLHSRFRRRLIRAAAEG
ncbi:MAG: hypothetical protein H0W04_05700 [Chthoniobacterales bacterium]|nr:hypothetical protein [Chthoniobacterales bacterium]